MLEIQLCHHRTKCIQYLSQHQTRSPFYSSSLSYIQIAHALSPAVEVLELRPGVIPAALSGDSSVFLWL